jgi:hypothetical protein
MRPISMKHPKLGMAAVSGVLFLWGCGDGGAAAPDGSAGAGGDGDIHVATAGIRLTLDGVAQEGQGALAILERPEATFNSVAGSFPNQVNFSVSWTGTRTGLVEPQADSLMMILIRPTGQYICGNGIAGSSCSLTLTAYGAKRGDRVACTFSGTLSRQKGTGPETLAITSGAFDLAQ